MWCWPFLPTTRRLLINDQIRQLFYALQRPPARSLPYVWRAWHGRCMDSGLEDALRHRQCGCRRRPHRHACTSTTPIPAGPPTALHPPSGSGAQKLAVTVPGVGAYLSGNPTVAHTWCPTGTVGQLRQHDRSIRRPTIRFTALTDVLAATTDGQHILGAAYADGGTLLSLTSA